MLAQLCLFPNEREQAMGVGGLAVAGGYFDEGAFYTTSGNEGVFFAALLAPVAGVSST
jgi:hypothetical protein